MRMGIGRQLLDAEPPAHPLPALRSPPPLALLLPRFFLKGGFQQFRRIRNLRWQYSGTTHDRIEALLRAGIGTDVCCCPPGACVSVGPLQIRLSGLKKGLGALRRSAVFVSLR
jgi:hypothetical protein